MSLPRHNPVLKGLYILAVLCMFTFMIIVIRAYWPKDMQMVQKKESAHTSGNEYASSEGTSQPSNSKLLTTTNTILNNGDGSNLEMLRLGKLINRTKKSIIGLPFTLDLKQDIEPQMEYLWRELYNENSLRRSNLIKSKDKVYLVYLNHDNSNGTVSLVLGYLAKSNQHNKSQRFSLVDIPEGKFLKRHAVLDTWNNANQLSAYLSYQNDCEIYELDQHYNVLSQIAYIRTIE